MRPVGGLSLLIRISFVRLAVWPGEFASQNFWPKPLRHVALTDKDNSVATSENKNQSTGAGGLKRNGTII